MDINLHGKTFVLVENTENGKVNQETRFDYQQEGDLVTADYYGGTIKYGKIIAKRTAQQLDMRYQCLTTDGELKAGKAIAQIELDKHGKIRLKLNWQWLDKADESGISEYVEL